MQHDRFSSVESLLDFLPDDELAIVSHLRELIFETIPEVSERLSYQVPYYRRHADICFIWPGAVPWGSTTQRGVRLGFTKGYLLPDETGWLEKGTRKQVYWRDFYSQKEIPDTIVETLLIAAVTLDNDLWNIKTIKKK